MDRNYAAAIQNHLMGSIDKPKAALNKVFTWIFSVSAPCFSSVFTAPSEQSARYLRIPFCYNDTKAHVTGVWYFSKVVFR